MHWEETAAQVLRRFQILQYADKEPRTALLFVLAAATVLRRWAAVEDDDLVYTEYGRRAGYLTGQLKQGKRSLISIRGVGNARDWFCPGKVIERRGY